MDDAGLRRGGVHGEGCRGGFRLRRERRVDVAPGERHVSVRPIEGGPSTGVGETFGVIAERRGVDHPRPGTADPP